MVKKILVLGATGMLGMPVVFKFLLKGYKVRVLSRSAHKAALIFGDIVEIVNGDVMDIEDLRHAMTGMDAVHINLSGQAELVGARNVAQLATGLGIKLITYISGDSVKEENTWFEQTRNKYEAEKAIEASGVDFIIYRPTWFMESIPLFVKDNRAVHLGLKDIYFHFLSADDYATIVAQSYSMPQAKGKKFHLYGPEKISFYEAVDKYRQVFHPNIKKVSRIPIFMAQFIAFLSYSEYLMRVSKMMKYFYKVGECGDPTETYKVFDPPKTTYGQWLEKRKKLTNPEFFEQFK